MMTEGDVTLHDIHDRSNNIVVKAQTPSLSASPQLLELLSALPSRSFSPAIGTTPTPRPNNASDPPLRHSFLPVIAPGCPQFFAGARKRPRVIAQQGGTPSFMANF